MALAGLVRHGGHAAVEELPGAADHVIPLEGRTRIHLVGLDVKMADNALVTLKISIRQLLEDEIQRMSKSLRHQTQRTRVQKLCRDLARSRTRQLKAFFDALPTTSASSPK